MPGSVLVSVLSLMGVNHIFSSSAWAQSLREGSGWILGKVLLRRSGDAQGVVGSPSLEVFQNHGDVALRDVVSGHGELSALLQP